MADATLMVENTRAKHCSVFSWLSVKSSPFLVAGADELSALGSRVKSATAATRRASGAMGESLLRGIRWPEGKAQVR